MAKHNDMSAIAEERKDVIWRRIACEHGKYPNHDEKLRNMDFQGYLLGNGN